ncbi:MAG: phosphopantothenoylcysteine decarboxylase/phosphopantothenate--cysteine ligase [Acidimicrobiaceae bacterium]|nr:phosphopantothenoylcysteine decarboxylase/phosphopantothenate--cysteine ligase [Acidimicrobiaceae bacterium]
MTTEEGSGPELDSLRGAFVVLGVTGGIAAYKAVEVCRRLVDAGAHVAPVLTEAAVRFIGPATFSALASEPAQTVLVGGAEPIPHTRLGRQADLVVVAPATARLIGEYAQGISRDLLVATLLATRAPVLCCPAMHAEMWEHPAVQHNLDVLRARGVHVLAPNRGRLAGGDVGMGRLAEPDQIVAAAAAVLARNSVAGERLDGVAHPDRPSGDLTGLHVLVTAGGTREPIDAVRYIANRSSGRQGHALAEDARDRGASVTLVSAAELAPPDGVHYVRVATAAELAEAVLARAEACDVIVMAAAVADFRPAAPKASKLSKRDGIPELVLEPTQDVLAELGRRRRPGQLLVGFAAETADLEARARAKLAAKDLDLIVANDVSVPGVGFGHETNAVTLIDRAGNELPVPMAPKRKIAAAVWDAVVGLRASLGVTEPSRGGDE